MRAVSSPSLTEAPIDTPPNSSPNYSTKPEPNGHIQNHHENDRGHPSGEFELSWHLITFSFSFFLSTASSGSVLQKFKKTFFKNGKSNVPIVESLETHESKHHRWVEILLIFLSFLSMSNLFSRFGPLVWRSSKERRKTKSHRRDKCNSGDSGIQVELENDENLSENVQSQRSMVRVYFCTSCFHEFSIKFRSFLGHFPAAECKGATCELSEGLNDIIHQVSIAPKRAERVDGIINQQQTLAKSTVGSRCDCVREQDDE